MFPRLLAECCLIAAALSILCAATFPNQQLAKVAEAAPVPVQTAIETRATGMAIGHHSRVVAVSVSGTQSLGAFGAIPYTRTWGVVTGMVTPDEVIHGLDALPHDRDGNYQYKSEFEIIAPTKSGVNSVIIVEPENRGSPVFLNAVNRLAVGGAPSIAIYPQDLGNGFLPEHATSYARVQWQAGIAAAVPQDAEGIGEVIVRDFGRWLEGRTKPDTPANFDPGSYPTAMLCGISLSGFFIDTFIAEGFNSDPVDGHAVFDGAIAVDGVGTWLALNQLAFTRESGEFPYVVPNGRPLSSAQLLKRPGSDPYYIDIANYTDFYRLRASLTDKLSFPARMRRYDWPSPHAAANGRPRPNCNGGVPVELNPVSYTPYLRAVTVERELGVESAKSALPLPPSTLFKLGPAPSSTANFNPLPGVTLEVPLTDADDQPIGGVRFPEVERPIGRPTPVSLPPVLTTSIDDLCGNSGEWQPLSSAQLTERYHDEANYPKLYAASLDKLIAEGFLLQTDRAEMLRRAATLYAQTAAR